MSKRPVPAPDWNSLPESVKAWIHDLESNSDPAGTLAELRLLQEAYKAQEKLIAELRHKVEQLQKDLDFQTEARTRDAISCRENFLDWRKAHHDPIRYRVMELEAEVERLRGEQ